MFTSAIDLKLKQRKRHLLRAVLACAGASAFCVVFDRVYAVFGHGVESDAMRLMFLYPLLGGAAPYLLMLVFFPGVRAAGHRFWFNLWNSGVAVLTVASMLKGIFDIAGNASPCVAPMSAAGWAAAGLAAAGYLCGLAIRKKTN